MKFIFRSGYICLTFGRLMLIFEIIFKIEAHFDSFNSMPLFLFKSTFGSLIEFSEINNIIAQYFHVVYSFKS